MIGRLTVSGQRFEILVDPYKALDFKKGSKLNLDEILAYPAIYHDVRTTKVVSSQDLQKFFGTTDIYKVAERIIREGDLQLTTDQRRQMVEQKKNQIASIISKKGINPQTNTPHPLQRILNAMDQAGVNVDPFQEAEFQVDRVIKEIKTIVPIKFQKIEFQFKIAPQFAGRAFQVLKGIGVVKQEHWLNDGSLQVAVEVLAGLQDELVQKISNLTHGQFESKILKREDV